MTMRPLNAFENKLILDYNKASYLNDIRYKCVRAVEVDAASGGTANNRSDYFSSMFALSNAIRAELGLSAAGEGLPPSGLSIASSPAPDELAALQAKIDQQEDDLIAQDEKIDALEEQVAILAALPATKAEADKQFTKAELLSLLYPDEA